MLKPFIALDVPRSQVLTMFRYEEEVKYSDEVQEVYSKIYKSSGKKGITMQPNDSLTNQGTELKDSELDPYKNINLDVEIQKHVLKVHGFLSREEDLREYWKLPKMYWIDPEIKDAVFYMRYNIFEYSRLIEAKQKGYDVSVFSNEVCQIELLPVSNEVAQGERPRSDHNFTNEDDTVPVINQSISLHSLFRGRPLILFAGSIT